MKLEVHQLPHDVPGISAADEDYAMCIELSSKCRQGLCSTNEAILTCVHLV